MKKTIKCIAIISQLSGCTFDLGTATAPAGTNNLQMQTDVLECKDKARLEQANTGKQVGEFFLGMTIIGLPGAYAIDRSVARSTYAECMNIKGYTVTLDDSTSRPKADVKSNSLPINKNKSEPRYATKVSFHGGDGWVDQPFPPNPSTNLVSYQINKTYDAGVQVLAETSQGITDIQQYTKSKCAFEASKLKDKYISESTRFKVNKADASSCIVNGIKDNMNLTYIITLIKGDREIATIYTWALSENFNNVRPMLESLNNKVKGL
jgi:hypothetical protein